MALTPAEQAQLDALVAKAAEPDDDDALDDIEEQLDDIEEQLDDIDQAEQAEAAAAAEPLVIVEQVPAPEPDLAAVIDAETRHDVAVIEAETDAAIRLREHEHEMHEREVESLDPTALVDEVLGEPILEAPADSIPRAVHPFFRKWAR